MNYEPVSKEQIMIETRWMVLIAAALIATAFSAVHLGKHIQGVRVEEKRQQIEEKSAEAIVLRRKCRAQWPLLGGHYDMCIRNIGER